MSTQSIIKTLHARIQKLTDKTAFVAPALIRITVGLVFIGTGWGKLHTLDNVTEFFTSLHIPLPALNARVASATEFFGGILILIGLGSRLVALPLSFTMVVAIITAKLEEVDGVIAFAGLTEWAYLVMFLVIALRGPGALSVDAFLARRFAATAADRAGLPKPLLRPNPVTTEATSV